MTFHLPEDLERFVHEAVRTGRYAREDDVIRDALVRLRDALPEATQPAAIGAKRRKAVPPQSPKPRRGIARSLWFRPIASSRPPRSPKD